MDKTQLLKNTIKKSMGGERQDVKMKVVSLCGNLLMLRQVTEVILIMAIPLHNKFYIRSEEINGYGAEMYLSLDIVVKGRVGF